MFLCSIDKSRATPSEQIENGGFETGDFTGWVTGKWNPLLDYLPIVSTSDVFSGTYSADLAYGQYIYQELPSGYYISPSSGLTFWHQGGYINPTGHLESLSVTVYFADGDRTHAFVWADEIAGPVGDNWYQYEMPLSPEDQIVKIMFAPCDPKALPMFPYHIDDVSLSGTLMSRFMCVMPNPWMRWWAPEGLNVNVTSVILNMDAQPQSYNITMRANSTQVGAQTVINLPPNETAVLPWVWNTSGFVYGKYVLSFYAWGGNFTGYNCLNVTTGVTILGDINGDFKVDLTDLFYLAYSYGSMPDYPKWVPEADANGDNIINLMDLVILAQHYGQHYP